MTQTGRIPVNSEEARLFSSAPAKLLSTVFGIASDETTFRKRGFRSGRPEAQARLEKIGATFVSGYHAALQSDNVTELSFSLSATAPDFSGFAFERAAMALTLLDHLSPCRPRRFAEFLSGPGETHAYMLLIVSGWAHARLPWLR